MEVIRQVMLNAHLRPIISVMIPKENAPILGWISLEREHGFLGFIRKSSITACEDQALFMCWNIHLLENCRGKKSNTL